MYWFVCFFVGAMNGVGRLWHDRNYGDVMPFCTTFVPSDSRCLRATTTYSVCSTVLHGRSSSVWPQKQEDVFLLFLFHSHRVCRKGDKERERVYIRYVLYARRLEAMTTDEERKLLRQTAKGGKRGNSAGCETLFALRPNAKKGDNFDASVCVA